MPRTHPGLCRAVCQCGLPGPRELPLTLYDPLSDPGRAELPAPFPSCPAFSQVCRQVAHSCRVKTTLSWTPGKFSLDLCRRGKNDSFWETRGSHLLRWVKMQSPVASKSRRTGWGSSWALLVRSRRSWALGVCTSGEVGGLDQRGFILGAEARCSRVLWSDTEVRNTATPNFHFFFFFFMLRTPLVGAASSTVSDSAFSCVCQRGSYHLCQSLFSHSLICVPMALGSCTVTLPTLCLA